MDLNNFYRDDLVGEYEVMIEVTATVRETVKADTAEEAKARVWAMLEANEINVYGDDIETSYIRWCRKTPPMFLINRPGTNVSATTHPQDGDEPRMPSERETNAYKPGDDQ